MRVYLVAEASGNWPVFSEDDVINLQVTEAVLAVGGKHAQEQKDTSEREAWKEAPKHDPSLLKG